jgi:drug/metabolite transporter (DMT)-like permease
VPAVALALAACLAWGCSDFLAGLRSRQLAVVWVLLVSQGTGLLLVLVAAGASGDALPDLPDAAWAVGAGAAELAGFAALYRALAVGSMSVVAPISGLAALVPVAVGMASGHAPTALQGLGITVALGGAAVASVESGGGGRRRLTAGMTLAGAAAVGFGAFFVGMDMAADDGALWAVALNRTASFGLVVVAVAALRRPCPLDRRSCAPLAAVGALDILANALFTVALTVGLASIVSVLGSLYSVATLLLARIVAHEQLAPRRYAGVSAALAGVALVSFG